MLSDLIESLIPCLSEELFTLKKNYTVALEVSHAFGKWPEAFGNSFFVESKWLVSDLIEMAKIKIYELAY